MSIMLEHQKAMTLSMQAKVFMAQGELNKAQEFYDAASDVENKVADYYLNKIELEPTRSLLLRSAVYLNLKANKFDQAEFYIYAALQHATDADVRMQLKEALRYCLDNQQEELSLTENGFEYLDHLKKTQVSYVIEPVDHRFSTFVTVNQALSFLQNIKSSFSSFTQILFANTFKDDDKYAAEIEKHSKFFAESAQPILAEAGIGSFKVSLATDSLNRMDEDKKIVMLKKDLLPTFHTKFMAADLHQGYIEDLKKEYDSENLDSIFRPILRIRDKNSQIKVSYIDRKSFKRRLISKTDNSHKNMLLTKTNVTADEIGVLSQVIKHTKAFGNKTRGKTILSRTFKNFSFDEAIDHVFSDKSGDIILTQSINITVEFDSTVGFSAEFGELAIRVEDTDHDSVIKKFNNAFINLVYVLREKAKDENYNLTDSEKGQWKLIKNLIADVNSL